METIEYIDAYFQQLLNEDERKAFERRCEEDDAFAHEVAFYITARQSLREELLQQKQSTWRVKKIIDDLLFIPTLKKSFTSRWISYVAAACLVLAASVYFFETNPSSKTLADNYIKSTYSNLGITMSADSDDLTLGMAAYNDKKFDRALQLFKSIEKKDESNSDAKKYAGLTYIQKKEYDSALQQFAELANTKNLFSNAGDFLKAVSLMARNKPGDKEEAKKLLHKVVIEKEEGNEQAAEWQKKL